MDPKQLSAFIGALLQNIDVMKAGVQRACNFESKAADATQYESSYNGAQAIIETLNAAGIEITNPNPHRHISDCDSAFFVAHHAANSHLNRDRAIGCKQFLREMYAPVEDPLKLALTKAKLNRSPPTDLLRDLKERFSPTTKAASAQQRLLGGLHPKIVERCQDVFDNGHFDEAIFNAMKVVEEEIRARIAAPQELVGVALVSEAMSSKSKGARLELSSVGPEQEAAHSLFRGAVGTIRNSQGHRFVDETEQPALETLAFASLLMRMLDRAKVVAPT
jgi:uncharacterized protein (TIGR02391 family)